MTIDNNSIVDTFSDDETDGDYSDDDADSDSDDEYPYKEDKEGKVSTDVQQRLLFSVIVITLSLQGYFHTIMFSDIIMISMMVQGVSTEVHGRRS